MCFTYKHCSCKFSFSAKRTMSSAYDNIISYQPVLRGLVVKVTVLPLMCMHMAQPWGDWEVVGLNPTVDWRARGPWFESWSQQ